MCGRERTASSKAARLPPASATSSGPTRGSATTGAAAGLLEREPVAPPSRTVQVLGLVDDDREQPGPKRRAVAEPSQLPVRLHERVLYGVLSVVARAEEEDSGLMRGHGVADDQDREGIQVAADRPIASASSVVALFGPLGPA